MNNASLDSESANRLLSALGEQLHAHGESLTLVVIGGSALLALGLVDRTTRDVDILAVLTETGLVSADPLPEALVAARDTVARDFGLAADWLNAGPASLVDLGLPEGLLERADPRRYGDALTVLLASRYDQIHFKLYAIVDQGAGKHLDDLQALAPTHAELLAAARWSRTHDPSEGYLSILNQVLLHLGVPDGSLEP